MKTSLGKVFWVLTIVLLGLSLPALAQTRSSLGGSVTDTNKAAVAGAAVKAKNVDTGEELVTTTDGQGSFVFPSVAAGKYDVSIEAKGFKSTNVKGVTVDVANPSRIAVALQVGDIKEEVIVSGSDQDVINTTSATLTNVIDPRQIKELPLVNRNPIDLARLQPNISVRGTDTRNATVAGLRGSATNITQDGINAMDNLVKTSSFFALTAPQVEATSEFSISVGTNGADAGRGVAQVNIVTQGGSNSIHGAATWFHRNSALNANSFFNNLAGTPIQRDIQNRIGLSAGGPFVIPGLYNGKDRSFWFFAYEAFREPLSTTSTRTVLTDSARQGLFKYTGADGTLTTVNLLALPGGANGPGPQVLNPVMQALFAKTPKSNTASTTCSGNADGLNYACFVWNVPGFSNQDRFNWRGDHTIKQTGSQSQKVEFTWSLALFNSSPDFLNSLQAPVPGGINGSQKSTRTLISTAIISTFGSAFTNEARYGLNRAPVGFLRDAPPEVPFFTTLSGAASNPINTFLSQGRDTTVYEFLDNFSWVHGSHSVKAGMDLQSITYTNFNDGGIFPRVTLGTNGSNLTNISSATGSANGTFPNLPGGSTGTTLAGRGAGLFNDVVGWLGSAAQGFNATSQTSGFVPGATFAQPIRQRDLSVYVADTWRFRNNLTLTPGLRWEFLGVPEVTNGLVVLPQAGSAALFGISGNNNLFNPNAPLGTSANLQAAAFTYGLAGPGTARSQIYREDWNNFAPSLGFAYSPNFENGWMKRILGSAGKSSIRGGYSISYLRDGLTVASTLFGTNAGLSTTASNPTPTGVLGSTGVPIATPTFKIPTTDFNNSLINPTGNQVIDTTYNLTTPYVQQWSLGIEREIGRSTAIEIRYVGNHAIKQYRLISLNETNIFENGFLTEFQKAQNNLNICLANQVACKAAAGVTNTIPGTFSNFFNWLLPGQVDTNILGGVNGAGVTVPGFFSGISNVKLSGNGYSSTTFVNNLTQNNVGSFAGTLAASTTYAAGRANFPANFFRANPNALGGSFIYLNDTMSNYNSLVVELRRRFSNGMQFQFDYTLAKSFGNGTGNGSQTDQDNRQTLRDPKLDYRLSSVDQRHRFIGNILYELPVGPGKHFFNGGPKPLLKMIEGWQVNAIINWQSGSPLAFSSGRATFNGNSELPILLNGTTPEFFRENSGVFRTPWGVTFFNPSMLVLTCGSAVCGTAGAGSQITGSKLITDANGLPTILGAPAPGQHGDKRLNNFFYGPRFFQTDISVIKRTGIGERVKTEFRAELFNAFNNVNFGGPGSLTFDNTSTFGRITGQAGGASPRIVQLALRITF